MRRRAVVIAVLVALLGVLVPAVVANADNQLVDTELGAVDTASGKWFLRNGNQFFYGNPGDVPFMGDWDCDGIDTPGLYRQSDGFAYLRNSNTQGIADIRFFYGNPGDIPLAGDWDNNGCDTLSIYRPSEARFYIINRLGENNGGLGAADFSFIFGNPGDKPFVGDFDGDGITEVGLHRESSGFVYFRLTLTQGKADFQFFYGNPGDKIVAGDWDADGIETVAIYRPSQGKFYLRNSNTQGNADDEFSFGPGGSAVMPVAGKLTLPPPEGEVPPGGSIPPGQPGGPPISNAGRAEVRITPNGGIDSSTFASESFQILNDLSSGVNIEKVNIDLRTGMFIDMVFDPFGQAGHSGSVEKCVEVVGAQAAAVGLVQEGSDLCSNPYPFSLGTDEDGYDILTLRFTDFNPGEQFNFAVDVDPTSIKGSTGIGGSEGVGAVSGLELAGATLYVTFTDGAVVGEPFSDGTAGGVNALIRAGAPATPTLAVPGVTLTAQPALSAAHSAATGVAAGNRVVQVTTSAPAGSIVELVVVRASLECPGVPCADIDPLEANRALTVVHHSASLPSGSSSVDFTVSLSSGQMHYLVAVVKVSGLASLNSNVVILQAS